MPFASDAVPPSLSTLPLRFDFLHFSSLLMLPWLICLLLLYLTTWLTIPSVLLSSKRPASMVAWIGATVILPFLGPLLYLFFGSDRLRRKRLQRRGDVDRSSKKENPNSSPEFDLTTEEQALVRGVTTTNCNRLSGLDEIEILPDESYFDALLAKIESAQHHIHFQTYVWRNDEVGRTFLAALCHAARRGVEVRLLVDELGSFETKDEFFGPLLEAGGEFSWSYTLHPRRNRYFLNLRNHRKLQLIDGKQAFIGGMNVGREYLGRDPEVGDWHDLQVRLTGAALNGLQEIFLNDWFFATQRKVEADAYYRAPDHASSIPAAFVESGPDSDRKPFLKSVLLLCGFARENIDLFTPYFVPTSELVAAFQIAAARGVRVRLMVSEKNDHRFLVKIGRSYYETLMEFGVEIYEYAEAVHHAKVIIADQRWLMVGSANLDARSIDLNFELNILMRAPATCVELAKTYDAMFAASNRIDLATFRNRSRRQKIVEGLSRLWAPLL